MNWPFLSVFLAFLLTYVPLAPVWWAYRQVPARRPPWVPRARRAARGGRETFAAFAAGVLVAHLSSLDDHRLRVLTTTYIVAQIARMGTLAFGLVALETAVWLVSLAAIGALFAIPMIL